MKRTAVVALLFCLLITFAWLSIPHTAPADQPAIESSPALVPLAGAVASSTTAIPTPSPEPAPDPWTDEDVEAIARTLSGECYEDKPHDKRLVAEVILNRVSNEQWGDTVIEVITAAGQFHGYWNPSRDISDNDREIAIEALRGWYANDCEALSEYLFFEAGPNRENTFRSTY